MGNILKLDLCGDWQKIGQGMAVSTPYGSHQAMFWDVWLLVLDIFFDLDADPRNWVSIDLFFKYFFLEFGMTLIWPILGDLSRSNFFWEFANTNTLDDVLSGRNLSKKVRPWNITQSRSSQGQPNPKNKHLILYLWPLFDRPSIITSTWTNIHFTCMDKHRD